VALVLAIALTMRVAAALFGAAHSSLKRRPDAALQAPTTGV
jgi:hypothetical protein